MSENGYRPNFVDRAIGWLAPAWGLERARGRMGLQAVSGGVDRDRRIARAAKKKQGESYAPAGVDNAERADLVADSVCQVAENPLAFGIVDSKVSHVVGGGFRLQPRVDEAALGIEDGEALNDQIKREWQVHFNKTACDFSGLCDFGDLTAVAYRAMLETGDAFIVLRRDMTGVPGADVGAGDEGVSASPYNLQLQVLSGTRVATPDSQASNKNVRDGVLVDDEGRVQGYYVDTKGALGEGNARPEYRFIPVYSPAANRLQVIHLFRQTRAGQLRGNPDLTPVLGRLNDIDEFTRNELRASGVASLFTAFVRSMNSSTALLPGEAGFQTAGSRKLTGDPAQDEMRSGAILSLAPGEDITFANPNRPTTQFDQFVMSMLRQVGIGVGVPFEILIGHFTASYSASRAALVLAEIKFKAARRLIVERLCRPVYAEWFADAVAAGRISALGFEGADPAVRDSYLRSDWIGPGAPQLDAEKEAKAFALKHDNNFASLQQIVQELNGGDYEVLLDQLAKERKQLADRGLTSANVVAQLSPAAPVDAPVDEEVVDREAEDAPEDAEDGGGDERSGVDS